MNSAWRLSPLAIFPTDEELSLTYAGKKSQNYKKYVRNILKQTTKFVNGFLTYSASSLDHKYMLNINYYYFLIIN